MTGIEIEEHEDLGVAVVPVATAEVEAIHAVGVVGAVTGVAAEVVAGNGVGKGLGVAVHETDEMIDQASWIMKQAPPKQLVLESTAISLPPPPATDSPGALLPFPQGNIMSCY